MSTGGAIFLVVVLLICVGMALGFLIPAYNQQVEEINLLKAEVVRLQQELTHLHQTYGAEVSWLEKDRDKYRQAYEESLKSKEALQIENSQLQSLLNTEREEKAKLLSILQSLPNGSPEGVAQSQSMLPPDIIGQYNNEFIALLLGAGTFLIIVVGGYKAQTYHITRHMGKAACAHSQITAHSTPSQANLASHDYVTVRISRHQVRKYIFWLRHYSEQTGATPCRIGNGVSNDDPIDTGSHAMPMIESKAQAAANQLQGN
ncbi:MAG: hypothetical protein PVF74_00065 [Anaerolineales bacterium]|jgi:hypothetical protein